MNLSKLLQSRILTLALVTSVYSIHLWSWDQNESRTNQSSPRFTEKKDTDKKPYRKSIVYEENDQMFDQLLLQNSDLPSHRASYEIEENLAIALVQPDGRKMLLKVNLNQSLSNLRSELVSKGKISVDDIFQREDCDIFREDEKDWKVREVLVNTSLFLKSKNSISSPPLKNIENQTPPKLLVVVASKKEIVLGLEDEFREKQKIFSIWGSDINMSLTQYKHLLNNCDRDFGVEYDVFINVLNDLINLYGTRKEIASRYIYNPEGISAYATKIIENNNITIQSITRMIEDLKKIKTDEESIKLSKEQEHLIHYNNYARYGAEATFKYFFYKRKPYILTLALLHNQLLDELGLYTNLFGSEHPSKDNFIKINAESSFDLITFKERIKNPMDGQQLYFQVLEIAKNVKAVSERNERASQLKTMQENDHSKCTYDSKRTLKHKCLVADAARDYNKPGTDYYKKGLKNNTATDIWHKERAKCPKNPDNNCVVQ